MSRSAAPTPFVAGQTAAVLAAEPLDRRAYALLLKQECRLDCTEAAFETEDIRAALERSAVVLCHGSPLELRRTTRMAQGIPHSAPVVAVVAEVLPLVASLWRNGHLRGLLRPSCSIRALQDCMVYVTRGERFLGVPNREVAASVPAMEVGLTKREQEIFVLLGQGLRLKEAAAQMGIATRTADSHRTRLMRKLGVSNRTELAHRALSAGIIELPETALDSQGRIVEVNLSDARTPILDTDALAALVTQRPDATLNELRSLLGVKCALSTIWNALQRIAADRATDR